MVMTQSATLVIKQRTAPKTRFLLLCKLEEAAGLCCRLLNYDSCVVAREQRLGLVTHDGLEDTHERLGELVVKVVVGVEGDVVFEDVDWVL